MDGGAAWVGWKQYGLATMAADKKSDGRTYYNAHAWVAQRFGNGCSLSG